ECKRAAEVKDISTKFRPQALNQKMQNIITGNLEVLIGAVRQASLIIMFLLNRFLQAKEILEFSEVPSGIQQYPRFEYFEFNFLTTKRFRQNPLSELFNKVDSCTTRDDLLLHLLSLASEAQKATAQRKFPLPSRLDAKVFNLYFSLFNLIIFPSNCAF
ncbi:hypothetical protein B296_00051515, partial [Ensete ventricosum]